MNQYANLQKKYNFQMALIWSIIGISYLIIWLNPLFISYSGKGTGTHLAEIHLRDFTRFQWFVIPLLLVVFNFYWDEYKKKNFSGILAGLAFFFMDIFNEVWNGLFHTATNGYAAVWMVNMDSAYQVTIGWNIEIIFMFLMMGIGSTKFLPSDPLKTWFGINNRHIIAIFMALLCVGVEIVLNQIGALQWNFWWWQADFPYLILLTGYLPFWEISFLIYDIKDRIKQIQIVSAMGILSITAFIVFSSMKLI